MMEETNETIRTDLKKLLRDHRAPVSRRDFLSLGLMTAAGYSLVPFAHAENYMRGISHKLQNTQTHLDDSSLPAFLVFDLVGGAALPANFLVGKMGGPEDLLASYNQLGWDPRKDALDRRFGLPMAGGNISKILVGMNEVMSADAQNQFRFASILNFSIDDTSSNRMSALSMASKFGLTGTLVSQALGLISTNSGGNTRNVIEDAIYKPVQITSALTIDPLIVLGERVKSVNPKERSLIMQMMQAMSKHQSKKIRSQNPENLSAFVGAQYGDASMRTSNAVNTDPRFNDFAKSIYAINETTNQSNRNVLISSIALNSISGITGPGVITIGGCDYHDGTQSSGDAKDLEIGREIGRSIEMAHRLKRPLFIQILTDGGVYAREGTRSWQGDASFKSMGLMGFYHPSKSPNYRVKDKFQIGAYTDGQGVDQNHFIGNSPTLAAYAAFANYLNVSGRISEFAKFAPGIFTPAQLDSILIFDSMGS